MIASLVLTVLSTVHTKDKNFEVILYTPILAVVSLVFQKYYTFIVHTPV